MMVDMEEGHIGGRVEEPKPSDPGVPFTLLDMNPEIKSFESDISPPHVGTELVVMHTEDS